jgi:hypothetical protein
LRATPTALLATPPPKLNRRRVPPIIYRILNLACRDINDQLSQLYRVTRSFEPFCGHDEEYDRSAEMPQVPVSSN